MLTEPCPLEKRPEPLDGIGVRQSLGVGLRVVDDRVRDKRPGGVVRLELVGDENRAFWGDAVLNELQDSPPAQIICHPCGDAPVALDSPDYGGLPSAAPPLALQGGGLLCLFGLRGLPPK